MSEPAERMVELPTKTREFLSDLSPEDIATIKNGLPIIRMIIGFGKVTKWLAITSLGLLVGTVMLWETVQKIIGWFKPPP
ncbi:hypothetical protein CO731_05083 [Aminobacter sp. MSH1]|uniref:hypothetical protein n=1 Tax=Aminobacter sp. MSH1 TaxID=374606 RepID=UPI000D5059D6|nr:hypothetical protein [Aminobacter sp. MSH1]AWC25584.1 hypothetical protein CO731_05083 [Aminobacter sp. MSH1]